jgi:predicted ATPase
VLRTLSLKNIRGFVDATIELSPVTVFVGTNGSGKTTVLECLDMLCRASQTPHFSRPAQRFFTGRLAHDQLITRGETSAQATIESEVGTYRLSIGADTKWAQPGEPLPRSMVFQLVPARLSTPSYLTQAEPHLEGDGGGLAAILDYLIGLRDGSIERIEEDLRAIVPQARRIRVIPQRIVFDELVEDDPRDDTRRSVTRSHMGSRFELEFGKMGFIPASALSEGTLIVIGILTAIHREAGPTLVLLDDIDRGLHPVAQGSLIQALRALVERRGDLQLVCTTHSSYALDAFAADEVHVTWMDSDGVAYHRKLSEHPEWPEWKSVMDPGEFWSTVGERWVGELKGT